MSLKGGCEAALCVSGKSGKPQTPMKRTTNRSDGKKVPLRKSVLESVSAEMVDKTRGLFSGKPCLSEALKRERRKRRKKDRW